MDEVQAQKLEKFTRSVNIEAGEHITKILDKANKLSDEKIQKAEDDALSDAYNRIQKSVRETESKYRRMYALAEQEFRMETLKHREELSQKIFKDVEVKIAEFASSDNYECYLKKLIDEETLSENSVIVLSPKDEKLGEKFKTEYGYEVKLDDSIILGGLSIIDSSQGIIIDKTFDNALEEQRKNFSSMYNFKSEG